MNNLIECCMKKEAYITGVNVSEELKKGLV